MKKIEFNIILDIYEKQISKSIKNKKRLYDFDKMKIQYMNYIYNTLTSGKYDGGKYNVFMITSPKKRIVMSQNLCDKIMNHYITKEILEPKLERYLDDRNIATRKNYGVSYGISLVKKYFEKLKKEGNFYCLKIDISKYFYNINHEVLKKMIEDKLDKDEFLCIDKVIDSTNQEYINNHIRNLKAKYNAKDIPLYQKGKGLPIGNLTSQFLAIFYFHELDHKIVHNYKIKYYVRYMDGATV